MSQYPTRSEPFINTATPDPHSTLEANEFVCVTCGAVSREHDRDGMSECVDCVEADDR